MSGGRRCGRDAVIAALTPPRVAVAEYTAGTPTGSLLPEERAALGKPPRDECGSLRPVAAARTKLWQSSACRPHRSCVAPIASRYGRPGWSAASPTAAATMGRRSPEARISPPSASTPNRTSRCRTASSILWRCRRSRRGSVSVVIASTGTGCSSARRRGRFQGVVPAHGARAPVRRRPGALGAGPRRVPRRLARRRPYAAHGSACATGVLRRALGGQRRPPVRRGSGGCRRPVGAATASSTGSIVVLTVLTTSRPAQPMSSRNSSSERTRPPTITRLRRS